MNRSIVRSGRGCASTFLFTERPDEKIFISTVAALEKQGAEAFINALPDLETIILSMHDSLRGLQAALISVRHTPPRGCITTNENSRTGRICSLK
jgi:hypothetical protein